MAQNTKIMPCTCRHTFQDERYGRGMRLHNYAAKAGSGGTGAWRCTVCEKVKPAESGEVTANALKKQ